MEDESSRTENFWVRRKVKVKIYSSILLLLVHLLRILISSFDEDESFENIPLNSFSYSARGMRYLTFNIRVCKMILEFLFS